MHRVQAFTLIELLITLVIAGIMLVWAAPAFYTFIQNQRSQTLSHDFISALSIARSEAIRTGQAVSICPSADANQTSCSASANWSLGFIVFRDPNADGVLASANDRVMTYPQFTGGRTLSTSVALVTFRSDGFLEAGAGNFVLDATDCQGNYARTVNLSNIGRIRVTVGACS